MPTNQLSLRRLALNAALITGSVVTVAAFVLAWIFEAPEPWIIGVSSGVITALLSWFVFLYYLRNFVDNRIRTLYKTIYNLKDTQVNPGESDDLMLQMEREVTEWMKNRSTEIEDLKKLEHYRREFVGNVSHELKTPIFNIQGYVTTLLDGGLEDPAINRNYLERAERSVERMINIVEDLESISRLEAGEMTIERSPFDIYELVMEVYYAQEMNAKSKNIRLVFRDPYKAMYVVADKDRIRQVLTNLVTNSIKYGKEGGETESRFYDMGDHILVEVSDNGIGIPKEHLPRLFERFYRVDKGRSRDQGGTGLGLAIVKHILEAHGQTINVRSSEGIGSTFSFTLPKAK
jgi:two-component system, OmpR family, phosphate regulon sensor histidine kinase PhoR